MWGPIKAAAFEMGQGVVAAGLTPLHVNIVIALAGLALTNRLLPAVREMFIKAGLFGIDLNKAGRVKVPESAGVIVGAVYLVCMFVFIPVPYVWLRFQQHDVEFPYRNFVEFISALLSICCMVFLGFADDVLNVKWRYKLVLPTIASLPLLLVSAPDFPAADCAGLLLPPTSMELC